MFAIVVLTLLVIAAHAALLWAILRASGQSSASDPEPFEHPDDWGGV